MGLPCATPERQPAPDPTATAVAGRRLPYGFGLPVGCTMGAPRMSPAFPRSVSPLVLLSLLLLLRGHCQQRNSQTHRCRPLASPGGNLCCPPTCLCATAVGVLKEKMGLRHPSVICVDNVFLLFVCFPPPVILMQRLSSLMTGMWGNAMPGQCIISATEVVFSAFLVSLFSLSFYPAFLVPPLIFSAFRLPLGEAFASVSDVGRTKLIESLARHLGAF